MVWEMDNEEAIETLKQLILQGTDERLKKDYEAIDIAIKALETGEKYDFYIRGYKQGMSDFSTKKEGMWIIHNNYHENCRYGCNQKTLQHFPMLQSFLFHLSLPFLSPLISAPQFGQKLLLILFKLPH